MNPKETVPAEHDPVVEAESLKNEEVVEDVRISIDDLMKVEVQVGTVLSCEAVPETDKLLKLSVDFAEPTGPRQIISGIHEYVESPESLVGRQLAFVTNLAPRTIKGLESNGMLFAVGSKETFAFLTPDRLVPPGTSAR